MKHLYRLLAVLLVVAVLPTESVAQESGSISGRVVDAATGQPLGGVQIGIIGTNRGTVTNQEGRFLLPGVPAGRVTIEVNFIGYERVTREVTVGASAVTLNFELEPDILRLDELVVVGYGVERRRNVAGSISSMRPTEIAEVIPAPAVDQILQGRLAGVQVMQNSGNPGAAISVRVRGASSISAGNQPLYVVDGMPVIQGSFTEASLNSTFGGQDVDALADLNPTEIESIEVLKDASAAAIYGSRASNGVVLITTKRGAALQRPDITFNAYWGVQRDWRRVEFLDTDEYIDVYNESIANDFGIPNYFGYTNDGVDNEVEIEPGVNTDWLDQVLRTAPVASMSASMSGGNERTRYYVAGSLFEQEGIVKSFGYERLNGRVNLDYAASDRLSLGTNVSLTRGVTRRARGDNTIYGPFANSLANPPYEKVYNDDGSYNTTLYANPVGLNEESAAEDRSIRILGNAFGSFEVAPGLSLRGSVGLDQLTLRSRLYDSPIVGPATASNGSATVADAFVNKLTYEGTLNWLRDFGTSHSISGVLGASYEDNTTERQSVVGQQFPSAYFRYLTSAASITSGSSSLTDWTMSSFFSRFSYTFADRYTATVNIRTDGSSRFGSNNRWGTFPSASLLWRASEEDFMRDVGIFDNLALRVSYGRTGNQHGIGNYAARGLFSGGNNYGDEPGLAPWQLANPELKWETTDQFNLGTDLALLGDRLSLSLDYYIKKTNDLLIRRPIPGTTGFEDIWSNVGALENRGFEVLARADVLRGDGLNWTVDVNFSRNRNEVTELYGGQPIDVGFAGRIMEGQPLGVFYGYIMDGIFRDQAAVDAHAHQHDDTAPGDIRFRDINGRDENGKLTGEPDGIINDADRTVIGSPWPDFTGGVTNTLRYGGFDLSAFVQFSYGNDIYNANRIYQEAYGSFFDNHTKRALDRWTPENPDATEPRATWDDPNENSRDSSRFIEDGSYVRLKNVVFGYTVPNGFASRLGLRSLRVYLQGQNLLTSTNYTGFDPEVNYSGNDDVNRGVDFYTLPQARTFTAGFNVRF